MTLDERVTAPNASTFFLPSFAFWTLSPDHPPNNLQVTPCIYIYARVHPSKYAQHLVYDLFRNDVNSHQNFTSPRHLLF